MDLPMSEMILITPRYGDALAWAIVGCLGSGPIGL
jgi:hypothetical protein